MRKEIQFQKLISDITPEQWDVINKLAAGVDEQRWLEIQAFARGAVEEGTGGIEGLKLDEQEIEELKAGLSSHAFRFKNRRYFYLLEDSGTEIDFDESCFGLPFKELLEFDEKMIKESNLDYYDIDDTYIYLKYFCECLKKIYKGVGLNNDKLIVQKLENKSYQYSCIAAFLNFHLSHFSDKINFFQQHIIDAVCTNLKKDVLPDAEIRKIVFEWVYENSLRYSILPPKKGYIVYLDEDTDMSMWESEEITYPNHTPLFNTLPTTNSHYEQSQNYRDFERRGIYTGGNNIKKKREGFSLDAKLVLLNKLGFFELDKVKKLTNIEKSQILEKITDRSLEGIRTRLSSIGTLRNDLSDDTIQLIEALIDPHLSKSHKE